MLSKRTTEWLNESVGICPTCKKPVKRTDRRVGVGDPFKDPAGHRIYHLECKPKSRTQRKRATRVTRDDW